MTYSAANAFTAISKENGLAQSFGMKSGGGGCSVLYTVFPNQLVMTYSSDFAIVSNDLEIYEDGIEPDYLTSSYDFENELNRLYSYFSEIFESTIQTEKSGDTETYTVSSSYVPEDITLQKVVVEVIDIASGLVISSTDYDSFDFTHSETYTNLTSPFTVRITVYYQYEIFNLREIIYSSNHS